MTPGLGRDALVEPSAADVETAAGTATAARRRRGRRRTRAAAPASWRCAKATRWVRALRMSSRSTSLGGADQPWLRAHRATVCSVEVQRSSPRRSRRGGARRAARRGSRRAWESGSRAPSDRLRARTSTAGRGVLGLGNLAVAGDERERHAVDLGVLGFEAAGLGVGGVAAPAQPAADDLLAEQLAAEGADAEDVGDGVGVPAFGEHRHGDDAADVLAELALLADGVHRLAQQVGVGQLVDVGAGVAQAVGLLERLDLARGVLAELGPERLSGLELRGVDEDRALPGGSRRRPPRWSAAERLPGSETGVPSGSSTSCPAIQSNTSFETTVLGHTTIITGGGSPSAARLAS